ncbi:MAG: membrane-bound lytic murein transglycosylase F [Candidatus Endobugula sp.]|jgi:membrane-bound lytic murein transglycosylase F
MNNSESTTDSKTTVINRVIIFVGTCILCAMPLFLTSSTPPTVLEKVVDSGVLQIVSSNGPSTFYEGPFGNTGFEYELAYAFAEELGVELSIIDVNNREQMISSITNKNGYFAAAGIAIPSGKKQISEKDIRFSTPYLHPTQQIIYQRDMRKPKTIDDLLDKDIAVVANSSHVTTLKKLQKNYPDLQWREIPNSDMAGMLELVHTGRADITFADSTTFITNSVIFPRARVAFLLAEEDDIAWAFPTLSDNSLFNAANRFLARSIDDGKITALTEKYFSKPAVDEGNALAFVKRIEKRLPKWVDFFKASASQHELDWLFLAAISYQESLWNEDAKSYTGVRGLMMLTNRTAKGLGIEDRTDPQQSIEGGSQYFINMRKRIPKGVQEPDRTWMALAAYNVGLGHLEDARVLTQRDGKDPNLWGDVKQYLPLLAKPKYYRTTRHGYARGWEPVTYVKRIRNYHNILIWHHENVRRQEVTVAIEEATEEEVVAVDTAQP